MSVIRTWRCLNSRCSSTFDNWEANPSCPDCRCVRVEWVPGGGHVGGYSKSADVELRALADCFRMDNMHSAERGQAAKVIKTPPPAGSQVHTFAGGFTAAINPMAGPQCVPTSNHLDFKVKATPGNRLGPGALGAPNMRSNTAVEATHKAGT